MDTVKTGYDEVNKMVEKFNTDWNNTEITGTSNIPESKKLELSNKILEVKKK